jgi:hypothetical protein
MGVISGVDKLMKKNRAELRNSVKLETKSFTQTGQKSLSEKAILKQTPEIKAQSLEVLMKMPFRFQEEQVQRP